MRITMFGLLHWLFIKPYTFYWVAIAAAGVAAAGAVWGALSGRSARKKDARLKGELTALNNQMINMETAESIRKLEKTHEQVQGTAKAMIGGSGISREGSNQNYLDQIEMQFEGEKDWLKKSAEKRKQKNAVETQLGIQASSAQGKADNINAITNLAGFFKE